LGRIDDVLVTPHFFRDALATEVAGDAEFKKHFAAAEPAILMPGTLQSGSGNDMRRATRVNVDGVRESFWTLGQGGPKTPLADGEIAITASLARELGAEIGNNVQLVIGAAGAMPADSFVGEKREAGASRPPEVGAAW